MTNSAPGKIRNLRWYIGVVLFLSTVINYIDRQTLNVLAPHIKSEFGWDNTTFAFLIVSFRAAYSIGQTLAGRFLDVIGVRKGLTLTVAFYSVSAMLASLATGLRSFCFFRFLLGLGEAANWPGATKTVSEWFPRQESGWAVALFDSGSAIGGAVAPFIVFWAYYHFHSWRPVFLVTGVLGLLWIPLFRMLYRKPEEQPRLSAAERETILRHRADTSPVSGQERWSYRKLLRLPETWGVILSKSLTDPVWFFITDWFAIYLVSKGYRPEESLLAFWVPFLAADIGNFVGGGLSSYLIRRGWPVERSRKVVAAICGVAMSLISVAAFLNSLSWLVVVFAISTLAYAGFSTIILALPTDLFPTGSVATVSGMSGTGAGIFTIVASLLTGVVADRYSFRPVLLGASLAPLIAIAVVWILVPQKTTAPPVGAAS
jgi:ACS family hexuronate transporter-like MFS transporter